MDLGGWLDGVVQPAQLQAAKPLVLAVELPQIPICRSRSTCTTQR